jgi:hypothetical protein
LKLTTSDPPWSRNMEKKLTSLIDFFPGSMTSPHKKKSKTTQKKSLQNAMTTSHEYGIITFKCDQTKTHNFFLY